MCDRAGLLKACLRVFRKYVQRRNRITQGQMHTIGKSRFHDENSSSSSANFNLELLVLQLELVLME